MLRRYVIFLSVTREPRFTAERPQSIIVFQARSAWAI